MKTDVHIASPREFQNRLMAAFLQKVTGLKYTYDTDSSLNSVLDRKKDRALLILLDCLDVDFDNLWIRLGVGLNYKHKASLIALFNVSPHSEMECEALRRGVHGIFFENDLPAHLAKGVQAILRGELWFSRKALIKCLSKAKDSKVPPREKDSPLTFRETEVLTMVASGLPNPEIAQALCISQSTVKNHLYKIYDKIEVSNRFQAMVWASENF